MAESEEQEGLWFEDPPAGSSRRVSRRRSWVVVASVVCIAALVVPVSVALSSSGPTAKPTKSASPHVTRSVAERQLISALSATTSSGSFNVSYEFDPATPPTVTTTTTTQAPTCHVIVLPQGAGEVLPQSEGQGTASSVTGGAASVAPGAPPMSPQTSEVCTGGSVGRPVDLGQLGHHRPRHHRY